MATPLPVTHASSGRPQGKRNRKVTTRVYRMALDPARFSPFDASVPEWTDVLAREVCAQGMSFNAIPGRTLKRRTWYLDTADRCLKRSGLSLRITEECVADKSFEVKLNCVSNDRYLAAAGAMTSRGDARTGFIEEVLPTGSRYVHSTVFRRRKFPRIDSLSDAARLYPGLARDSDRQRASHHSDAVSIVDGVVALELVQDIGVGVGGGCPPLKFELTATYMGTWRRGRRIDDEPERYMPDIVELSYSHECLPGKKPLECFSIDNVRRARRLLETLASRHNWMDKSRLTLFDILFRPSAAV